MTLPHIRAVGIAWYRREDWDELRKLFVDSAKLPATYDEWLAGAEQTAKQLAAQGHITEKVYINPREFGVWCAMRGLDIDAKARIRFANETVARMYRDQS